MQTLQEADPRGGRSPWMDEDLPPPSVHVTCDACWEGTIPLAMWTEGMTHPCENITLPKWAVIIGTGLFCDVLFLCPVI